MLRSLSWRLRLGLWGLARDFEITDSGDYEFKGFLDLVIWRLRDFATLKIQLQFFLPKIVQNFGFRLFSEFGRKCRIF